MHSASWNKIPMNGKPEKFSPNWNIKFDEVCVAVTLYKTGDQVTLVE